MTIQNPTQRLVVSRVPSSGSIFYHIGISCLRMSQTESGVTGRNWVGRREKETDNFES